MQKTAPKEKPEENPQKSPQKNQEKNIDAHIKAKLIQEATQAMKYAYAPYSHFSVGAAVLTRSGAIYRGANIENASYRLTSCAEHNAIIMAVMEGEHTLDAICVIANTPAPVSPCGACRQIIAEFASPKTYILLLNTEGKEYHSTLADLLPYYFTKDSFAEKPLPEETFHQKDEHKHPRHKTQGQKNA